MSDGVWTVDEAKSALEAVIAKAQAGEPQRITANGKEVVMVTKIEGPGATDTERRTDRPTLAEYLLSIPKGGDVEFESSNLPARPVEF